MNDRDGALLCFVRNQVKFFYLHGIARMRNIIQNPLMHPIRKHISGIIMLEIAIVFAIIGILIKMSTTSYQNQYHKVDKLNQVIQTLIQHEKV